MFIKNTGRYAFSFAIQKGGKEVKIAFDRRRYFLDSGNIATTGITEITEEDFKELKKQKAFKEMLDKGIFTEVDKDEPDTASQGALQAKDKEIAKLKKALAEKDAGVDKKELEDKDKEIASLKAQLEKLAGKGKKGSDDKDADAEGKDADAEGF